MAHAQRDGYTAVSSSQAPAFCSLFLFRQGAPGYGCGKGQGWHVSHGILRWGTMPGTGLDTKNSKRNKYLHFQF